MSAETRTKAVSVAAEATQPAPVLARLFVAALPVGVVDGHCDKGDPRDLAHLRLGEALDVAETREDALDRGVGPRALNGSRRVTRRRTAVDEVDHFVGFPSRWHRLAPQPWRGPDTVRGGRRSAA